MKKINLKLVALLIVLSVSGKAFSQFIVSGEFRPRAEFNNGYKTLKQWDGMAHFFTSQRTRLNFGYNTGRYKTFLSLQDVRVWGNQSQLVNNEDFGVSVHQAWADIKFGTQDAFSLKAGRQEIILDDHRIFGSVGWAQQARSHDAAILKYNKKKTKLQFALAYNQNGYSLKGTTYNVPKSYKTFQYLWLNQKFTENLTSSFLLLNKGDEVRLDKNADGKFTKGEFWNTYTQTIGTHTKYKKNKLGIVFNGFYQMGDVAKQKLGAYLVGLDVSYKASKKVTAIIGYEIQSGNSQTDTTASYAETNHAFSPFFGTNHKFNGFMDYFYVGNHNNSVGLQDIYLKLKYKGKKISLGGDVHMFSAAADVRDKTNTNLTTAMSANLGTEIDLYTGFKLTKGVAFKAGYSMMFGSETLEAIKGGDRTQMNNWAYAQIVIKPTFFNSKDYKLAKNK